MNTQNEKKKLNQLVGKLKNLPNVSTKIIEDRILLESKAKKMFITFNPESEKFTVLGNYSKKYLRKKIKEYNLFNESDQWKTGDIILLDAPNETTTDMYYGTIHDYDCDPRPTQTELSVKRLPLPPIENNLCQRVFFCYEIKS